MAHYLQEGVAVNKSLYRYITILIYNENKINIRMKLITGIGGAEFSFILCRRGQPYPIMCARMDINPKIMW